MKLSSLPRACTALLLALESARAAPKGDIAQVPLLISSREDGAAQQLHHASENRWRALHGLSKSAAFGSSGSGPLENIQVHHPPLVLGRRRCEVELLRHDFAFSYYEPAIADYRPPKHCGVAEEWAIVVLNLTVTSNGTQFDRLASLSLAQVEIWRTSTAEPTRSGIVWSYAKDVTRFSSLFRSPGRLMFELNNVVDDTYTGIFSTVLTATFYRSRPNFPAPAFADVILPITARSKNSSQMLVYPGDASVEVNVPQNSAEAWLEVLATGAAEEEFWYTSTLDRWRDYFPGSPMPGKGPLREVQVRVDGQLAGAFNPFPVIYTGGANPLLWRPLASLRAFDIPSFFLDISPFLPILCDGRSHNISFSVLGQGENGSISRHWFITGAMHIVLDTTDPPVRTTGRILRYNAPSFPLILSLGLPSPDGESLKTIVNASRRFELTAEVETGAGKKEVEVSGLGGFENTQYFTDRGDYEAVSQLAYSRYTSKHNNRTVLCDLSSFPLSITTNYTLFSTQHRFSAALDAYGYDRSLTLPPALGGVEGRARRTKSSQRGAAEILGRNGRASYGWGRTEEEYAYHGDRGETYHEEVKAENATIVRRKRWGSLAPADRDLDRTSGRERVVLPL